MTPHYAKRVIEDLRAARRRLLLFKRHARRDGDWLLDERPWKKGQQSPFDRFHIQQVEIWLLETRWLLRECARRIEAGDDAFMWALDLAKKGERLSARDDFDVYLPALEAHARQRTAMRKVNSSKQLTDAERASCQKLCAEYWNAHRPPYKRGAKGAMLRSVAKRSGLKIRRVRSYIEELPVPFPPE